MATSQPGSLLPYIFYFLIGFSVTLAFLLFLNTLEIKNFAFIEASLVGSSFSSYVFFRKYKRAMFFAEQSKITQVSIIILFLLSLLGLETLLHLNGNLEIKLTLLSKSLGIVMVVYGVCLSLTLIFTMSFFKISATIIHRYQNNPRKIIKVFLTLSLTVFIADIIINFLLNFLRH